MAWQVLHVRCPCDGCEPGDDPADLVAWRLALLGDRRNELLARLAEIDRQREQLASRLGGPPAPPRTLP
jgi:hypothetical protein